MKTLYTFLLLLALPLVTLGATGPGGGGSSGGGSATNAVSTVKTNGVNIGTGRTAMDFTNTTDISFVGSAAGAGVFVGANIRSGASIAAPQFSGTSAGSLIWPLNSLRIDTLNNVAVYLDALGSPQELNIGGSLSLDTGAGTLIGTGIETNGGSGTDISLYGNTTTPNLIAGSITMSNRLFAAPSPGGVIQIDGTWANVHTMTNQAQGSFSLVITNMSASQQWMVMVPGTASGSTNIIVTLIPETGKLIGLNSGTLGLTASTTATNLQWVNLIGNGVPFLSTNTFRVCDYDRGLQ
jgi:hypothetical protein